MFIRNWKKEILTIPNLLSLLRLALLPVYAGIYWNAANPLDHLLAGGIMLLSCLTDLLDGFIARRFGQVTNLGKVLDPLADKITQFTLTVCLSLKYPVLQPVLALFLVKEIFQLVVAIGFLRKGRVLPGALMTGKISTCVVFGTLIYLILFPDVPSSVVEAAAIADAVVLTVSFLSYILAYFGPAPGLQDVEG